MKNNIYLSIIIPCFNEKQTIQKVIKEILSLNLEVSFEIIIIDDSSNDGSKELIKKIKNSRIRKFYLKKRLCHKKGLYRSKRRIYFDSRRGSRV